MIETLLSFPTVIWLVPMLVVIIFWCFALLGAFDIEILDFGGDGDLELDLDVDANGVNPEAATGGVLGSIAELLSVGTIPITIIITAITTVGFVFTFVTDHFLGDSIAWIPVWIYTTVAMIVSFVVAVLIAAQIIRPMEPLFITHEQRGHANLIGQIVVITSSKVTDNFGTATCQAADHSAPLLLNVYNTREDIFNQDDEAVILSYNKDNDTYEVGPYRNELL